MPRDSQTKKRQRQPVRITVAVKTTPTASLPFLRYALFVCGVGILMHRFRFPMQSSSIR